MHRLLLLAAIFTTAARAQETIPVVNAGFEANFAAPRSFPVLIPTGWQLYDPGSIIDQTQDAVGVLNPTTSAFFPAGAPQGSTVALIFLAGDRGTTPVGLAQPVGALLEAGVRYTLSVQVGNIASGVGAPPFDQFFDLDGFPGYAVQLLAGGVVVAEDHNTLDGAIPEGEFRLSTASFTPAAGHPRLGQTLAVRVVNLNRAGTADEPGIEVDFDDVRLTRSRCPAITQSPEAIAACPLGAASFASQAIGTGPLTHRWQVADDATPDEWNDVADGANAAPGGGTFAASGAATPTLDLAALAPAASLHFRLRVGNACGETYSDPATLSIKTSDFNQDGNSDQDDIASLIDVVGGGPNGGGVDPDFNADGNTDQDDVAALVGWVAGGPCP